MNLCAVALGDVFCLENEGPHPSIGNKNSTAIPPTVAVIVVLFNLACCLGFAHAAPEDISPGIAANTVVMAIGGASADLCDHIPGVLRHFDLDFEYFQITVLVYIDFQVFRIDFDVF